MWKKQKIFWRLSKLILVTILGGNSWKNKFHVLFAIMFKKSLLVLLAICSLSLSLVQANDLLHKAFEPSVNQQTVVTIWNDKKSVGAWLFGGSITIGTDGIQKQDSLMIRLTRLLLRITLIAGVSMTLWHAVKLVIAFGSDTAIQAVAKSLWLMLLGIVVALMSVVIVSLLRSVGQSTITDTPGALSPWVESTAPSWWWGGWGGRSTPKAAPLEVIKAACADAPWFESACVSFCLNNPIKKYKPAGDDYVIPCPAG